MSASTHLLFLDDSGTKEYPRSSKPFAHVRWGGVSRHFVFAGPLLAKDAAALLGQAVAEAKRSTFGTAEVEIKSHWLRRPEQRKVRYLDPFKITEAELAQFVEDIYRLIDQADLELIAAVIDKQHMLEMYERPWYPPAVAYDLVLQRVQWGLPEGSQVGVTIDDMMGATVKGNPYRRNLERQHLQLQKNGSSLRRGLNYTCLHGRLRFVNSAHSHIVQLADLVAYNVLRQFRDYPEEWEQEGLMELPTYEWFDRICPKFRCGQNGRVQGFGVVKFPRLRTIRWSVEEAGS